MRVRGWGAVFGACAFVASVQAYAQDQYAAEYTRRLKVSQTIDPHGPTPFGEQLNPYTGDLNFTQTDVVLEGTGPTIRLVRSHVSMQLGEGIVEPYSMGDWTLSIPRIETLADADWHVAVAVDPGLNWNVRTTDPSNELKRCTYFDRPAFHGTLDDPFKGWNGMTLVTEDGNQQSVLKRNAALNPSRPTITEATNFPAVTQQFWQIGCLAQTSNGEEGEAFLVVSPDGTKYWLDYLSGVRAIGLREPDPAGSPETLRQGRMLAWMYVSRIEDRFGNWVRYHYSGDELDYIDASDGRYVDISWLHVDGAGLISDIEVQPGSAPVRKWHYGYDTSTDSSGIVSAVLTSVTLPDQSRWTFALNNIGAQISDAHLDRCDLYKVRDESDLQANTPTYTTSTIKHPSGLLGTFIVRSTWHGRSYVESGCVRDFNNVEHESIPPLFGTMSLVSKQLSGPGLATQTWNYDYSPAVGSTTQDPCASTGTCVATSWVDVTGPDSNRTRHTYSTRWGSEEGKEIKTDHYQGATLLRSVTLAYAPFNGGLFPANLGSTMMDWHTNSDKQETLTPLDRTQITQQAVTFTHDATSFDAFGRETAAHDSNGLGYSRYVYTTYRDNKPKWVLGQIAKSTIGSVEASRTEYDTATDLPYRSYAFGKLQSTMAYNADGTMRTVADGNNRITTLSNWYRGIPRSIVFADAKSQSAVVSPHGWITSATDERGAVTKYEYDEMGRVRLITYPAGDTSAWDATTILFKSSSGASFGIAAGHWEQTVSTGKSRKVTYYDALWRPILTYEYEYGNEAATARYSAIAYDAFGHVSENAYPISSPPAMTNGTWGLPGVRTTYDALGRVAAVTQNSELFPLVTTTKYLNDFKTEVTNPRNYKTTTEFVAYDHPAYDQPTRIVTSSNAPASSTTTLITRDPFGKPTMMARGATP